MTLHKTTVTALFICWLISLGGFASRTAADDRDLKSVLVAAKERSLEEVYHLQYHFKRGEVLQWRVRHLGTTEATVRGNTQTSKMRAVSTKQWEVVEVDKQGNATFVHSVIDVDMWQKVSDRDEVRYNSSTDETPPAAIRNGSRHQAKT